MWWVAAASVAAGHPRPLAYGASLYLIAAPGAAASADGDPAARNSFPKQLVAA